MEEMVNSPELTNIEPKETNNTPTGDIPNESLSKGDPKTNYAFAKQRIEARETKKQLEEAQRKQAERDAFFAEQAKNAGFDDITTEDAYVERLREQERNKVLKNAGIDPTLLTAIVSATQPNIAKSVGDARMKSEIDELNEAYGTDIKTLDDVAKLPNAGKIIDLLAASADISLKNAYFAANSDTVQSTQREILKQQVINQARGFDHVKQTQGGGEIETVEVTQSEINDWRRMGFKGSDADIRKIIVKNKKEGW